MRKFQRSRYCSTNLPQTIIQAFLLKMLEKRFMTLCAQLKSLLRLLIIIALINVHYQKFQVFFAKKACQDCGQTGDPRFFEDFCHENPEEIQSNCCFPLSKVWKKKTVCSYCRQAWSKRCPLGYYTFTQGEIICLQTIERILINFCVM